jgi:hypothetical protein
LPGYCGDGLEVAVVAQDCQPLAFRCGSDEQVDRSSGYLRYLAGLGIPKLKPADAPDPPGLRRRAGVL